MIADWHMKYVGTPHEAANLPWLYQKYAGHDNNRDGFALNLPESQHLGRLMYREWMPQAYVDHHQMGSNNARLYIPPYAEPIRPDGDPLVWREIAWWGGHGVSPGGREQDRRHRQRDLFRLGATASTG